MNLDIAKKPLQIELNTLTNKPLKLTSTYFCGDDIYIEARMIENGLPKVCGSDSIAVCYFQTTDSGEIYEQIKDVDVENDLVKLRIDRRLIRPNANILSIKIDDSDQVIYLQQIVLVARQTPDMDLASQIPDEMQLIKDIKLKLELMQRLLKMLEESADTIQEHVVDLANDIATLRDLINAMVDEMIENTETRLGETLTHVDTIINGFLHGLDSGYMKAFKLDAYIGVNNRVAFTTGQLDMKASELVDTCFLLNIQSSPYTTSIKQQYLGILTFFNNNGTVTATLSTLANNAVQGNYITTTVNFNTTNLTTIPDTAKDFEIRFQTNGIASSLANSTAVLNSIKNTIKSTGELEGIYYEIL